jgi:hypothetical protein
MARYNLNFLLIAAMAKLALDLRVSSFAQLGRSVGQLVPEHEPVPLGTAVIAAVLFFPAAFGGKRDIRDGGAVRGLMRFRIGTDEAYKIDVVFLHFVT